MTPFIRALPLLVVVIALAGCKPDYPKCKTDAHCADKGEVCVDNLCVECSSDAQCREGFACQNNACVALPECRLDADCAAGERCRGSKCVPECTSDRECSATEKCQNSRCVARTTCTTSSDCPSGEGCRAGVCVEGRGDDYESQAEEAKRRRLENCTLETVNFDFNEFALSDQTRATLEQNAECIRFKNQNVVVAGHADERGTEEYNLVLGEKRANSVKRYLTGLGVPANLIRTVSYGEERPLDRRQTEEAWAKNRRAEFSFR